MAIETLKLLDELCVLVTAVHDEASARRGGWGVERLQKRRDELQRRLDRVYADIPIEARRSLRRTARANHPATTGFVGKRVERLRAKPWLWERIKGASRLAASITPPPEVPAETAQAVPEQKSLPALTEPERQLVTRYGWQRIVRLRVRNLPGDVGAHIHQRLNALVLMEGFVSWSDNGQYSITFGPVADLDALAAKIDFGWVVLIDRQTRRIVVHADAARLPLPRFGTEDADLHID